MSDSDADDHEAGDAALRAAHNVQGNRLSRQTEQQYRRYMEIFKVWVQESWAGGYDVLNAAGEFLLPMSKDLVESFLGYLATRRIPVRPARGVAVDPHIPVQSKPLCVSYITGVVSAIVWYHTSQGTRITPEVDVAVTNFKKGYKRTIAQMRRDNQYPMMEGKNFLTVVWHGDDESRPDSEPDAL